MGTQLAANAVTLTVIGHVNPYTCIGTNRAPAAPGQAIYGIAGLEGGTDEPTMVNISGICTAEIGGAVSADDDLEVGPDSQLIKAVDGKVVARAQQAGAVKGERIDVLMLALQ
ncbi:hypothetical protein [Shewanella xiamenensis]|uniref:hypothetical protein n=1 Tax=Shewanella xiamenensis TaxID=332186 RepID=UPI000849B529|nr:hypothetical protein [Shewanella xiamenensis]ODR86714.1 hypothetical protein ABT47_16085 [Shewanella xiamenensis]